MRSRCDVIAYNIVNIMTDLIYNGIFRYDEYVIQYIGIKELAFCNNI